MISRRVNITKKDILAKVSQADIFRYYIPTMVDFGKPFCSELREDKNPSCVVKQLNIGTMYYKDMAGGDVLDCFSYVQKKFGVGFQDALRIVARDFGIIPNSDVKALTRGFLGSAKKEQVEAKQTDIRIRAKMFDRNDIEYWNQYGISASTLDKFQVKSVERYWVNGTMFIPTSLCYAYLYGNYKYKIYQPNEFGHQRPGLKVYKWCTNVGTTRLDGYDQLPESGDLLFVTKSRKDVMTLYELGYCAVSPSSEGANIPVSSMDYLKERFKRVVVYYDNDVPGIKAAIKTADDYGLEYVHHPLDIVHKDPSDYRKNEGREKTIELIQSLL